MVLVLAAVTVWAHGNAVRASEEWKQAQMMQAFADARTSVFATQLPARQVPRGTEDGASAAVLGQALDCVPEPGAVMLLVVGGLGLFSHRRRRVR